jgi:hypothetical protein
VLTGIIERETTMVVILYGRIEMILLVALAAISLFLTNMGTRSNSIIVAADIDPSNCQESEMTQACKGPYQMKHAFYFYPKLWSDTLDVFNETDLIRCLDARPRWVQFVGDSTLRMIYLELVAMYYQIYIDHLNNKVPHQMEDKTTNISWVFKGKFMHSTDPRFEDMDVNNEFLVNISKSGRFPDAIVFSLGAHELITWSGRKQPTIGVEKFMHDVDDFLIFLDELGFFNRTNVYFTNMNSLRGWRFQFPELSKLRDYACEEQKYACKAFKAKGARVLDLYSISNPYADLADKPGLHYKKPVLTEQVKAIFYDICKREGLAK